MSNRNKNKPKAKQGFNSTHKKEEYNLKESFARLNPYRSSNPYQTYYDDQQEDSQLSQLLSSSNLNDPQNTNTDIIGNNYFRLEDKIESLSNKNDIAHDSMRKEIKQDIKEMSDGLKDCMSKKGFWTIMAILIPIIIAIVGGVITQLSLANRNKDAIIEMKTTIERSVIPSIEENKKNIEKNSNDIKSNTERIMQSQKKK